MNCSRNEAVLSFLPFSVLAVRPTLSLPIKEARGIASKSDIMIGKTLHSKQVS